MFKGEEKNSDVEVFTVSKFRGNKLLVEKKYQGGESFLDFLYIAISNKGELEEGTTYEVRSEIYEQGVDLVPPSPFYGVIKENNNKWVLELNTNY